jgi:uncharacterized protein YkwD
MGKRIILFLSIAGLLLGVWYYMESRRPGTSTVEQIAQQAGDALLQATQGVSMPPPLRATQESETARLMKSGVLLWTNNQRHDNGDLDPFSASAGLDAAASAKLKDLFAKQYFEHISPTGVGPSDLAKGSGYEYAVIGENLALGNFKDDQELVQAWMDSPGHRANILNLGYTEIGIAVGQGLFEGRRTWIAVQEFAKPRSACPLIDADLKAKIADDESEVKRLVAETKQGKAELDAMGKPRTDEGRVTYNRTVDAYNASIGKINDLAALIKTEIDAYNLQVRAYNDCANGP